MKHLAYLCVLALSSCVLRAAEIPSTPPSDLVVHEWGTFTSVAGPDGAAIDWDALGGKDDLPRFVNDFGFRCFKWRVTGTVRMETPVIYFYSSEQFAARVKVSFPNGLITEWYPKADYQVFQKDRADGATHRLEPSLNGIDTSLNTLTGAIEWPNIQVRPNTSPALPTENSPSRYYAARGTDSAPLAVGDQHEKFLFYRGVGRFPVPLTARVDGNGSVAIENHNAEAVPMVILFQNRDGQIGYRNLGGLQNDTVVDLPPLDNSLPALREELEQALVAQGLFPKEAQAMVETWRDSWFEPGARLIYIVPSRAVDAFLPLHVDPAPTQVARVFVGRIELITPEVTQAVGNALLAGDLEKAKPYGRFLGPILDRIVADNPALSSAAQNFWSAIESSYNAGACR